MDCLLNFLNLLGMKSHTGEEMANQVLQYLREICKLNFPKCRGKSYDNAGNMSRRYNGMQQKIRNKPSLLCMCSVQLIY